jgi:hypothetical protein
MNRETLLSEDRVYRHILWRVSPPDKTYACFILLNPSDADETLDDPTVRRCVGFTQFWGYDSTCIVNLHDFRTPDPQTLRTTSLLTSSSKNDEWIRKAAEGACVVIAGWGNHGDFQGRGAAVKALLQDFSLKCLGKNKDGSPKHPLYLRKDASLLDF